jgi:hypothetical protein
VKKCYGRILQESYCWDQIAEGYLISNTGEKSEGGIARAGER